MLQLIENFSCNKIDQNLVTLFYSRCNFSYQGFLILFWMIFWCFFVQEKFNFDPVVPWSSHHPTPLPREQSAGLIPMFYSVCVSTKAGNINPARARRRRKENKKWSHRFSLEKDILEYEYILYRSVLCAVIRIIFWLTLDIFTNSDQCSWEKKSIASKKTYHLKKNSLVPTN